ncbi:nuclease-related domain-containing protein [Nocardioides daejeonensis]|uniref:nuclease-related domain-containing protein n=1 Tax=Nocardioides daejeonensis TaxID=1046556 RepID=UPI00194E7913|nr:nuclease-related domain-containing protein [Nocardioides daejeonensis]
MDAPNDEKQMRLRYAGTCRLCGSELPARTEAVYERSTKTVRCLTCPASNGVTPPASAEAATIDPGVPGGSARREYERRQAKREERIRTKHPRLGGLILALSDDPQSTKAWDTGALGEERLGARLTELSNENLRVLHDRRIPGTKANIDHLAVTPTGVYVIDAKRYRGRPHLKVEGGLLRPRTEKLMVGTRDRTKLVDGVLKQVDLVRRIVGDDVPVTGVLCFIEADWPLLGGAFTTRDVDVLWPKRLYPRLAADGAYGGVIASVHQALGTALAQA